MNFRELIEPIRGLYDAFGVLHMPSRTMQAVPAFIPDALTASRVGAWETDFENDCTIGDATTAKMFGLDARLAADGLPFTYWIAGIHPGDRQAFAEKIGPLRESGGFFVFEYRTCPAPNVVRWLLARGRYEYDGRAGGVVGRGIVIDITDSKRDGYAEDRAFFVGPVENETPLERAAAHVLEARRAIDEVDPGARKPLRKAVDALLWAVGRALARKNMLH